MRSIVWFRGKDLRLCDHIPLHEALKTGEVIPVYVLDSPLEAPKNAQLFAHSVQFLLESIDELSREIHRLGSTLLVHQGPSEEILPRLAEIFKADRIVTQRCVEPTSRTSEMNVRARLRIPLEVFEGLTLRPSGSILSLIGQPFSVFTPFSRALQSQLVCGSELPAPYRLPPLPTDILNATMKMPSLAQLGISKNIHLLTGGENQANERLRVFLEGPALHYHKQRDRLDLSGTSRLSADLKFGTLSIRSVWLQAKRALQDSSPLAWEAFSRELIWREFTHDMLWHNPGLLQHPFRPAFRDFPWHQNDAFWLAWQKGFTGYPIVDAAARQLLQEGFVHNRARMIAASFLTKHLLLSYQQGEGHYMHFLTDGDVAQNNAGWQWSAGCGCDAQPYFRIFNPTLQGEKFDPHGQYVRRYVTELSTLPDTFIHRPWEAPPSLLQKAGVVLGKTYPFPIVDHAQARQKFLGIAKHHFTSAKP